MSLESTLTIAGLFLHPLKSGASLAVHQATVSDTGLQYDREWMVVDADGEFVSQRELPRMVQIKPELRHSELVLRAPGMLPLHLRLDGAEGELQVRVWNDTMQAFDMGDLAAPASAGGTSRKPSATRSTSSCGFSCHACI